VRRALSVHAMTISKASSSHVSAFGIEVAHEGKSAFSTSFSWSA
jgi:hypothetical protein